MANLTLSTKEILTGIFGILVGGVFVWSITSNIQNTARLQALETLEPRVSEALTMSLTVKLKSEQALLESEQALQSAKQNIDEAKSIVAEVQATPLFAKVEESMESLRGVARTEAERIVKTYIDSIKSLPVIATLQVEGGKVINASPGVIYNAGVVTFPNPRNYKYVPVVSDFSGQNFMTEKVYVNGLLSNDSFRVWQTPLDTGNRNRAPWSFTAIVVASTF